MNEHHHNAMQKGTPPVSLYSQGHRSLVHLLHPLPTGLDDVRLDHVSQAGQMAIYGATTGVLRNASSNSNSPSGASGLNNHHNLAGLNLGGSLSMSHGHNPSSALLVVPQPINASKIGPPLGPGAGRKYQCKMCPQVCFMVNSPTPRLLSPAA